MNEDRDLWHSLYQCGMLHHLTPFSTLINKKHIYLHHLTSTTVPLIYEGSQVDSASILLVWVGFGKLGSLCFLSFLVVDWNIRRSLFLLFLPSMMLTLLPWSGRIEAPVRGLTLVFWGPRLVAVFVCDCLFVVTNAYELFYHFKMWTTPCAIVVLGFNSF